MEASNKLHPGQAFEAETFRRLDGPDHRFGDAGRWQALFVFRGQHCGVCKSYLRKLQAVLPEFTELGIALAAVSADDEAQTRVTQAASEPSFPLLYGMDRAAMRRLGLYVSEPESAKQTDHAFAEPALFVVNADGRLQVVELANAPFVRPDLGMLLEGLKHMIEDAAPVHGTSG